MKFTNLVLAAAAAFVDNAMAYTWYKNGKPNNAYYITHKTNNYKGDGSNEQCNCEIFCSQYSGCTYFSTQTDNCYLYNSGTTTSWDAAASSYTTYSSAGGGTNCFNGVYDITVVARNADGTVSADGGYYSFWTGVAFKVVVYNEWYYFTTAIIAYYEAWWKSIMYSFLAPVWVIVFWLEGWSLGNINYNLTAYDLGLEWFQDNYINNFTKQVEYHYMRYATGYGTNDIDDVFVKTLIIFGVWIIDVYTLLTGVISNTVFLPLQLYFILVEIIIQSNNTAKSRFYSQFGLDYASYGYTGDDASKNFWL